MAAIDKTKEQIGWLKVTFALLVAIDASLIGWLVQNFSQINALAHNGFRVGGKEDVRKKHTKH